MMKGKDSYDSDYESRSRRRKRSDSERRRSRSRTRSRSSHRHHRRSSSMHMKRYDHNHHDNHSHHNHNYQRHYRTYRGSSGTRGYKRSRDREIRLEQYYRYNSKKWDSFHSDSVKSHRRSCDRSSRRQERSRRSSKHESRNTRRKSSSYNNAGSSHVKDDDEGHLIYRAGDVLQSRYEVRTLLGEGTFGKCLECYDRKRDRVIALKVIKNIEKYREAAKLEIKVLMKLARKDPEQKKLCIQLLSTFNHYGHVCLSFPKLGKSVFDFMKENLYQPYTMPQVQHITYQLLMSVRFLHSIKLTHTDLKPENMLFVDSAYDKIWSETARQDIHILRNSDIRLIDFGSATSDDEHHSTIVSTRHYRAPEVVLELGWSQPCDIWSCGCIMYELFTGNTLFQTHDNKEHLAMMEHILGPLPPHMVNASKKTKYFNNGALIWDPKSSEGKYVRDNCKTLKEYVLLGQRGNNHLFDILKQMLAYDPKERITAVDALKHPYFTSALYGCQTDCTR